MKQHQPRQIQSFCVTILIPCLLTFFTGASSRTPGFRRLVSHRGALKWVRASDLRFLHSSARANKTAAMGIDSFRNAVFSARSESKIAA